MSSTDEPEVQTEKSAARPNFLGKLWKAQVPSTTGSALPSEPAVAATSSIATSPPSIPLSSETQVSESLPVEVFSEAVEDPKAAPPSKFLSKLWKAQKSGGDSQSTTSNNALTEQNVFTESSRDTEPDLLQDRSAPDVQTSEVSAEDCIPLEEFQESLKLDEAALIGDPYGATEFSEPANPNEFGSDAQATEPSQFAEITSSTESKQPVEKKELTSEERKAQRKTALETYERMKEEQRLKTERGNTVRALNSLNLPPASPNTNSVSDADPDNAPAIASGAMLDPLVSRQSFASTVAAAPAAAPRAERAAGANEFVRKYPLLVVLGVAVLAAGIAYYPTENAQSNFASGETLLRNNQPEPAIKSFTRAISSNPKMVAAYVERANAYFQTGATDLALADCKKAIELDPSKPEAYELRAKIELPSGHFRQVIADLVTVSKIRATLPPAAMATLGHAYMGDGQYSHALIQFSKKLDRDPDDLQSLVAKAKCYLAMNLPHKAIESCDLAVVKAGNAYDAYVLRGECEDQLGNGTAALKDFDKAISLDGRRAAAFLSRGMYFAHIGDFAKASQDMDSGLKRPEGIPDGRYKHAMVYALQKNKTNALEQFKLLEAKPDFKIDNWFYIQRSDVYAQLEDFRMARADLERALSNDHAYQTACWLRLARCFESEHDYKRAASYAGKVLADEPTNSTALLKHSKYSLLSGNRMTAMDDLYKAIASAPKNPLPYVARGDIYVQDKQYSLADDDYQKASRLAPLNSEIKKKLMACNEFVKRPKASPQETQDKPVVLSAAAQKEIASADLQTLDRKGYEALKSGRADYAVAALTRAIYLNSNDGNARRYLAYALLKTGNAADAAQQFYAWEKIANPDPLSSIAFVKFFAAQTDAQNLFEHLAERYRTNAQVLLEIARQCAFYHYDSVEGSALDFATKVATSDEQVAINRLRISLDSTSGKSSAPAAVSGAKPITVAN